MHKILVVAKTEFLTAVQTKAFIVSLLMLPVIYAVAFGAQRLASRVDTKPRTFAVIDRTGALFGPIDEAAKARRKSIVDAAGKPILPDFVPVQIKEEGRSAQETALSLSDRVRSGELEAFIEIPADSIDSASVNPVAWNYHSDSPNFGDLRVWLDRTIGDAARQSRYKAAGVTPELAQKIDRKTTVANLGLFTRTASASTGTASGEILKAKPIDVVRTKIVPLALAFIVFIVSMSSTPQLLTSVMEEKMSRISEMLLGSVSTFELMMGKLLGNAATSLVSAGVYLGGAYLAAWQYGYADAVTPGLLAILALYVTLSVLVFGSLYMAVGSACSEFKDAQTMMMPVMMLSMIPFFVVTAVLDNPSGPISVFTSLIPFASPTLMPMRIVMTPAAPAWQVALSVVLTSLTAVLCVWASGKIFRTGLLMHGKAPTFGEMARWVTMK